MVRKIFVSGLVALDCGSCGHSCLGGTCGAGMCKPIVLTTGQVNPDDIAVSSDSVYWTELGHSINGGTRDDGRIRRIGLSGGTVQDIATGMEPNRLAVSSTLVYYTANTGFWQVPLTGGASVVAPGEARPSCSTGRTTLPPRAQSCGWRNRRALASLPASSYPDHAPSESRQALIR
jgi:hypothetical protein